MVPVSKRDPRTIGRLTPVPEKPAEPAAETAEEKQILLDRIAELEGRLAAAETGGLPRRLGFRIAPKGGISVYGLNANFPVTLYLEQWLRLEEQMSELKQFAEANKDLLDMKDDSPDVLKAKQTKRQEMGIVPKLQFRVERIVTPTVARKTA